MGYFTQQLYNNPMPAYVDPNLGLLMQASTALQQRHDKNRADMDAFDIMASNVQVHNNDDLIKKQAIERMKQGIGEIAAKGDYAMARPRLGMVVKDFSTDQALNTAQENFKAIQDYNKRRAELAEKGQVFDFNPADKFSTLAQDGSLNRFQSAVENKLDWDKTMADVTRLQANSNTSGLSEAQIRDYLQYGTNTGISDKRVKAYLDEGYNRYMNTAEGNQHMRVLTDLYGIDKDTAAKRIMNDLYGVAKAQEFSRNDTNYLENRAETRRQAKADKGDENANLESPFARLIYDASKTNADGSFGTSWTDKEAKDIWQPTSIKDNNGANIPGVLVTGPKIFDFADKVTGVDPKVVKTAPTYFGTLKSFDEEINSIKADIVPMSKSPQGSVGSIASALGAQRRKEADAKIKEVEAKKQAFLGKYSKEQVAEYNKYKSQLGDSKIQLQNTLGKMLTDLPLVSNVNTASKTGLKAVDGEMYSDMVGKIKGSELISRIGNVNEFLGMDNETIKMMRDEGVLSLGKDETIDPEKVYDIKYTTRFNSGEQQGQNFDVSALGAGKIAERDAAYSANRAQMMELVANKGRLLNSLGNENSRGQVVQAISSSLAANPALNAQQKAEITNYINGRISNYKSLSQQEKEELAEQLHILGTGQ